MATGLAALAKIAKQSQESNSSGGGDFNWFKLPKAGDSKRVRFLQELDSGSDHYRQDKGLAHVFSEHVSPKDYRKKMKCSMEDEGKCFGCEQHRADPKAGWRAKYRLYTAVLVKGDDGNSEVQIISQTTTSRSIFNALVEYAQESGAITDRSWKITRNGEGKDTSYSIIAFDREPNGYDDMDKYDLPDIEKVATRTIPYEEQAAFFNDGAPLETADTNSSGGGWGTNESKDSPLSGW